MKAFCKALPMFLFTLGFTSSAAIAQEHCKGQAPTHHDMGVENFLTTSRVYQGRGVQVYETCVENLAKNDLWINWGIPGPTTYVLYGTAIQSGRTFLTRDSIDAESCLEYGNIGDTLRERFIGHSSDANDLADEKNSGCLPGKRNATMPTPETRPESIQSEIRLFVPSDKGNSSQTMLEFVATSTNIRTEGLSYIHDLSYSINGVAGREAGNPDVMTIRLAEGPVASFMVASAKADYLSKGMALGYKGEIRLEINASSEPTLRQARYEILDGNYELVGAFMAPVWTPQAQ